MLQRPRSKLWQCRNYDKKHLKERAKEQNHIRDGFRKFVEEYANIAEYWIKMYQPKTSGGFALTSGEYPKCAAHIATKLLILRKWYYDPFSI